MALPRRIHIFGASGSGTTSLASLLAARHGHRRGPEMRSRALHDAWLAALPGPTLRLEGDRSVAEQLAQIEAAVEAGLG